MADKKKKKKRKVGRPKKRGRKKGSKQKEASHYPSTREMKAKAMEKNLYEEYVRKYKETEARMAPREMAVPKLSEREFYDTYESYAADAKAEIRAGKKKTMGNLINKMVSDQKYEMSTAEAEALLKAAETAAGRDKDKVKVYQKKLEDIRAGKNKDVEDIKKLMEQANKDLKLEGLSSYERAKWIKENIIGSP